MREIKFRAWNQDEQEFQHFVFSQGGHWSHNIESYSTNAVQEWQQYTGIKDKNGVEIYEGDIVSRVGGGLLGDPTKVMFTGEVIFTNSGYKAKYLYDEPGTAGKYRHEAHGNIFNQSELEVIGNIYENPELLK